MKQNIAGSLVTLAAAALASENVPASASAPSDAVILSKQLVSYSWQYEQLPIFAGTPDSPNTFTVNLLQNLRDITGVMPMIRVGGTTQDDTVYHADQYDEPVYSNGHDDQGEKRPTQYIGPSYFDSFQAIPNTTFIAGLNLARQGTNPGDGSNARQSLLEIANQTCITLGDNLHLLEMGNEPDLFVTYGRRPSPYTANEYVSDWTDAVNAVRDGPCGASVSFFGNSFTGPYGAGPKPLDAFNDGQNSNGAIAEISEHNYMASAAHANLQYDLMSHPAIQSNISGHTHLMSEISYLGLPYVLGETNSLYGGHAGQGLSDVMGSALWAIDFTLWAAVSNIERLHFHQAVNNPYNAWAPEDSSDYSMGTMASYYGHLFTARVVGDEPDTQLANIPLSNSNYEAAYAAYAGGQLVRIALINMRQYDADSGTRGTKTYVVQTGNSDFTSAKIERLQAPGSDSTTGLTFGGQQFEIATNGQPAAAPNAPSNSIETVEVPDGSVTVTTDSSEAVLITFS